MNEIYLYLLRKESNPMAQILCSTGALIGRPNNRDYRLLEGFAKQLHCDGFEFMMYDSWYEQAEDIVAFLQKLELNIPVMHCEKRMGEAISRGAEADLKEAFRLFAINCDMAHRIGAKKMVVHLWDGITSDQNIENNIKAYGELAKIASNYEVDVLVENVVCNKQDPMTHWCELVQAYPDIKFIFDTKMAAFHNQLELLYQEDYRWLCENHIKHYHVNDYAGGYMDWANLKTLPIGKGHIYFDEFFGFIHKTGYDDTFTVEATAFNTEGVVDVEMLNRCFERIRGYMEKDRIVLKKPTIAYAEDIAAFRQEIEEAGDTDAFAGCSGLEDSATVEGWIQDVEILRNEATCPVDKVPSDVFLAVRLSDNRIVGIIDLRYHINHPILGLWGRHIGYSVRPSERKKGYAAEMLRQDLLEAKKLGLDKVMVTCNPNNIASEKAIIANGGIFEKEIDVDGDRVKRFWIYLSLLLTTQNTRDLGGYPTQDGKITKRLSLIRSDIQGRPCEEDFAFLKSHHITTIIDMRGEKDVQKRPSGFAGVEGFTYHNCPIDEGSGVPESVEAVPKSYMDIACAPGMKDVFKIIANATTGVMFNCTAGKDRTGVVSAILLCHAGVKDDDIITNYVLTREYGKERLELIHKNFPEIDMRIVTPNEAYMETFLQMFRARFGDTQNYFKELGLREAEIDSIYSKLVENR